MSRSGRLGCCVGFRNQLPVVTSCPRFLFTLQLFLVASYALMPCGAFFLCPSPLAAASMTADTIQTLLDLKVAFRLQNIRNLSKWWLGSDLFGCSRNPRMPFVKSPRLQEDKPGGADISSSPSLAWSPSVKR